jgi:NaMN:DMB phosphoribosyltransferase
MDKARSDSKSIQTQQELYSTKLSLIEERMANQQKSQSVLQLISAVVGTLTLVVAGILLTKP